MARICDSGRPHTAAERLGSSSCGSARPRSASRNATWRGSSAWEVGHFNPRGDLHSANGQAPDQIDGDSVDRDLCGVEGLPPGVVLELGVFDHAADLGLPGNGFAMPSAPPPTLV